SGLEQEQRQKDVEEDVGVNRKIQNRAGHAREMSEGLMARQHRRTRTDRDTDHRQQNGRRKAHAGSQRLDQSDDHQQAGDKQEDYFQVHELIPRRFDIANRSTERAARHRKSMPSLANTTFSRTQTRLTSQKG